MVAYPRLDSLVSLAKWTTAGAWLINFVLRLPTSPLGWVYKEVNAAHFMKKCCHWKHSANNHQLFSAGTWESWWLSSPRFATPGNKQVWSSDDLGHGTIVAGSDLPWLEICFVFVIDVHKVRTTAVLQTKRWKAFFLAGLCINKISTATSFDQASTCTPFLGKASCWRSMPICHYTRHNVSKFNKRKPFSIKSLSCPLVAIFIFYTKKKFPYD